MSRNLCDETFPASLLIEFDELDDEIPISPDLPTRHQPKAHTRHHSTLTGGGPPGEHVISDKAHHGEDRNGSRTVISGSSNSSSGHSSLSTEGENRSEHSSDRDMSRDLGKRRSAPDVSHGVMAGPAEKLRLAQPRKLRQPRSMESLLLERSGGSGSRGRRTPTPQSGAGFGLYAAEGGGSCSNIRNSSSGGLQQYQRNRSGKYGHVQSKVKQLIDEMKPPASHRERKEFVRHKSMPETYEAPAGHEHDKELDQETDLETLKAVVREMTVRMRDLEHQLSIRDVCSANVFNEMATLKCKNSALRMEIDQLLEQERAREQRRQILRQCDHHAGSCYGSQSSLHKTAQSACTVATQTSPRVMAFVEGLDFPTSPDRPPGISCSSALKRGSSLSAGGKLRRSIVEPTAASSTIESMVDVPVIGEFSPDYEQLIPALGRSDESSSFLQNLRVREHRSPQPGEAAERTETDQGEGIACRDCRKKRKKRKSRKQKLASLFCIRRHDESL